MSREFSMDFFPEGNEAKDLLCFFSFSNIGVGIAESATVGIVCEKNQDAGLAPASGRDVVALHHRVFPIVGNGMEIQVKGVASQKAVSPELLMPEGKEPQSCLALDRAGVLRKIALLGRYIQPGKQCQTLIRDQRHDMALSLNGPEFEGKAGAQGVSGRDHPRTGQASGGGQMLDVELDQVRDKEKKASKTGTEPAGRQREGSHISNRFYGGSGILRSLVVQTPWQRSEAFFMEDLTDSSRTETDAAILEDFADLVDRVVFLSHLDDSVPCGGLAGSGRRPTSRRGKETGMGIPAEVVTEHPEGSRGVAEIGGYLVGGFVFDEIGSQSFILPLLGLRGFEEKASAFC